MNIQIEAGEFKAMCFHLLDEVHHVTYASYADASRVRTS
jgi:hypothetical protein